VNHQADFDAAFPAVATLSHASLQIERLDAVSDKLTADPTPDDPVAPASAEKLVEALEEMSLVFTAIEGEFTRYFAIDLRALSTEEREHLDGMSIGKAKQRLEELRGHCTKISNTYRQHVAAWVDRVMNQAIAQVDGDSPEAQAEREALTAQQYGVHSLFDSFGHQYDIQMVEAVSELGVWFQERAAATVDYVDNQQFDEAVRHRIKARAEVKTARATVIDAFTKIAALRAKFDAVNVK
jgi:hypothetical protein